MGRRSSIRRLDPKVRAAADIAIHNGATIEQIVELLTSMGADVSRSAVGRYSKGVRVAADVRNDVLAAMRSMGIEPGSDDDKIGRLNIQLSQAIMLRSQLKMLEDEEAKVDWKSNRDMSVAVKNTEGAAKDNIEREIKLKEQARKEALEDAAKAADGAARRAGASPETIEIIKREILGLTAD